MTNDESSLPTLYMGEAAATLTTICNAIDNGADLDETMLELFNTTATQLSEGVDRRKGAARYLKGAIEQAKAYEEQVTSHRKKLESALAKLKVMTKEIVEANPDIPFKDGLGKKLSIVKNSKPSVKYDFELTYKSVRNVLPTFRDELPLSDEELLRYGVPSEFLALDTGKVLADLQAGVELSWAELAQGYHLRGL